MRVDAERNRAKVIEAAMAAFEAEGLSVPVAEIARRAGVGTGTVSRHFPTKESLYEAIVLVRLEEIVREGRRLLAAPEPGFFAFVDYLVAQMTANRGLAEALAGGGFDVEAAAARSELDLLGVEEQLLAEAQRAGVVRPGVTRDDVKALMVACVGRPQLVEVVTAGLRP
jgi:AcrR family transcriptional regulator